jgi:outer membrane receptor for ferrienterochelin and colicin
MSPLQVQQWYFQGPTITISQALMAVSLSGMYLPEITNWKFLLFPTNPISKALILPAINRYWLALETVSSYILGAVEVVTNTRLGNTEASARATERNAMNVMNVISAREIEFSPDVTVANVVQRVSGVSLERSSSGDGQHAIVRGMDKRYNYTLVNGIKIPSPDPKNRYVPLDIFPSELLDRLEVTKALTPSMEGDAIGGLWI